MSGTYVTLRFPAEHPVVDVLPLDALPRAAAPVLMPGPPVPDESSLPDQRPAQQKTAAVVGAVAAVVAVVVIVALVSTANSGSPTTSSSGTGDPATSTTTSAYVQTFTPTSAPSPVLTDEDSAKQWLENEVATNRTQVEALNGYWVPQLSSKRHGLVANGITYDYQAVWSDFASLRARYPRALLLWSGEYSSFRVPNFWVTIVPEFFGTGESANNWCASEGIGKEDCYAKRITHTGSHTENTLLRK